jgi:hypothetical protein
MDRTRTPPAPSTVPAPAPDTGESVVARLWRVFHGEPMLLVTFGYLFVSVIGLWDSYWFYRRFDLPILEFMQSSDYFVAGLRRPAYAFVLGFVVLTSAATLWPERWRQRHPERAARLQRRWWGRLLVPRRTDWWIYAGLHPETLATIVGALVAGLLLFSYSTQRAERIHRGGGTAVRVQLADAPAPLAGDWRLLGTSSAFVYVGEPTQRRVETLPIEAIARIVPQGIAKPPKHRRSVPADTAK